MLGYINIYRGRELQSIISCYLFCMIYGVIRSLIILIMTGAELYAATIRIYLWCLGKLDPLQQDMTIKNVLFIGSVYGAYNMWMNAEERYW